MKENSGSFSAKEQKLFKKLNTPKKIQDFINSIPINFEKDGVTCMSPARVLREKRAHCIEGAMLAAYILSTHGHPPLLMDLRVAKKNTKDFDHVVALFKVSGYWGAISKTNHAVLRYREPIYKTLRELALSYFHEYFTNDGKKNLRDFSKPFNLRQFGRGWVYEEKDLWKVPLALNKVAHFPLLTRSQTQNLRRADKIEIRAGKLTEN